MKSITLARLTELGLFNNSKLVNYEMLSPAETGEVLLEILLILNDFEYQKNPSLWLANKKADRGPTKEFRYPDDIIIDFIETNINKI